MLDIRDAVPLLTHNTTAHTAEKNLGRSYVLCLALGHANRKMDRESFFLEMRFSLTIPMSLDFEIYILDRLARYFVPSLTWFERELEEGILITAIDRKRPILQRLIALISRMRVMF